MFTFICIIGFITFFVSVLLLAFSKIRKKPNKKIKIVLLLGLSMFLVGGIIDANFIKHDTRIDKPPFESNKKNKSSYKYHYEVIENDIKDLQLSSKIDKALYTVGIKNVTGVFAPFKSDNGDSNHTISVDDFDYDNTLLVTVAKIEGNYIVKEIKEKDSYYSYYVDDSIRYDKDGNEKYDIYDYKTRKQVVTAYIKPLSDEELEQLEQDRLQSEQEKLEASKTILDEIGRLFESNSISASETYQDKTHFITATVDSVDATMTGKPRVEVYQNNYKVQCVFNDGMTDKVKSLNKGDVITFYGTLDGWGVSADFTHCYFK